MNNVDQWRTSNKVSIATWPGTAWPQAMQYGSETNYVNGTLYSAEPVNPPDLPQWHYDGQSGVGETDFKTMDTEMKLATGGHRGSTAKNLWCISASVTAYTNWDDIFGEPVPSEQISIGGFGNLDTNGELYVELSDNDPDSVTPRVKGKDRYTFVVNAQKFHLAHQTIFPALSNTNLNRTTIGVGEYVTLSGMPTTTKWSTTAGGLSATSGSSTLLTAPSNAVNATVIAMVASIPVKVPFDVKAPSGIDHAVILNNNSNLFALGYAGARMDMTIYLAPTSVSFYRVNLMEIPGPASNVTGFFTNSPPYHSSAGYWSSVGYLNNFGDSPGCTAPGLPPPFVPSGFDYVIPSKWQVQGSLTTNDLTTWTQSVRILNANGDCSISKFGKTVTRSTNNIATP